MTADNYLIKAEDIDGMAGLSRTHFLNPNAVRINKSLGDKSGSTDMQA